MKHVFSSEISEILLREQENIAAESDHLDLAQSPFLHPNARIA